MTSAPPSGDARRRGAVLALLLALGVLLRGDLMGTPFIEYFSNRQVQNSIPMRLLQEGRYSFSTLPLGFHQSLVIVEFQLLPLIVIAGYRGLELLGLARLPAPGHDDEALRYYVQIATLGRAWSLAMSLLTMACLYGLVRDGWSLTAGRLALLWYAVLPHPRFFDQLFLTEPTMAGLGTFVLYQLWRWSRTGERWRLAVAAPALAMALLLKPSQAIIGVPIAFLFLRRHGRRAPLHIESWLFAAVVLAPAFFFYAGSWVGHFGDLAIYYAKTTLTDWSYTSSMLRAYLRRHLWTIWSPVGSGLILAAAMATVRERAPGRRTLAYFLWIALLAWVAYWLVLGPTLSGHLYYQLPSVPVAVALMGIGSAWLVESRPTAVRWSVIAAGVVWFLAFNQVVQGHNDAGSRFWRGDWCRTLLKAGLAADRRARPDALVVAGAREAVGGMLLYYAHREGSVLAVDGPRAGDDVPARTLEFHRKQGASLYFAAYRYDGPKHNGVVFTRETFDALPIASYLRERYAVLEEDDEHLVVDLTAPRPGAPALASPLGPEEEP